MSAHALAARVRRRELSPEEAVAVAVERLAARTELNAVITVCADEALARARRLRPGDGPLAGVPIVVKDLIDTAGIRTTFASRIYAKRVPARSAPAVLALERAGAVIVAKANADEFAWGVTGQNEFYGDMVNPRHPGRIAGGSSGGNAAALAADLVPLALGTDTGGSVRMPAGACEVIGFKPALGEVSVEGVHPLAASYDTVGPMAQTVADCALAHAILTGAPPPVPRIGGRRVGVLVRPPDITGGGAEPGDRDPRADAILERLRELGAIVSEVELPAPEGDTWPVFLADAAAAHAATFPSRADEYGRAVRAKLETASRVSRDEAQRARRLLRAWREVALARPDVDLIASPTLGMTRLPPSGVDELAIRLPFSSYTRPFSLLGWPAIAIGDLQLAGRSSAGVLGAALAIEAARGAVG